MKLACVVLRKKGGRGGVRLCVCVFVCIPQSAHVSFQFKWERLSHSKGMDTFAGGREGERERWEKRLRD